MEHGAYLYCSCGQLGNVITEPEGGQTLFGTASFKALQHAKECSATAKVYPVWIDENDELEIVTSEKSIRQNHIEDNTMYYE